MQYEGTQRPAQAANRYDPGAATHTLIPNRHAQVTMPVGPGTFTMPSVAGRTGGDLVGPQYPGGEVVLGTDIVVQPRTNAEWINGINSRWYGRHTEAIHS